MSRGVKTEAGDGDCDDLEGTDVRVRNEVLEAN